MTGNERARKHIRDIVAKVVADYQPQKVILFGSYAYGRPDEDSDIDMLIVKDTQERPLDRRIRVSRLAFDWKRDIPFEPLVLTSDELARRLEMGDDFFSEIVDRGEVLYGGD